MAWTEASFLRARGEHVMNSKTSIPSPSLHAPAQVEQLANLPVGPIRPRKRIKTLQNLAPQKSFTQVKIVTNPIYSAAIVPPSKLELFTAPPAGTTLSGFMAAHPGMPCAVNGGFFDLLPGAGMVPTGLVISGGTCWWPSSLQVAEGQDKRRLMHADKAKRESQWSQVFFISLERDCGFISSVMEFDSRFRQTDYSDLYLAIEAGPRLISNGLLAPDEFGRLGSANTSLQRTAIGVKENGEVILFCSKVPLTFPQVAEQLLAMGAVDAMALDGGPSSGFEAGGKPSAQAGQNTSPLNTILFTLP